MAAKKPAEGELKLDDILSKLNKDFKTNLQFANASKGLDIERIKTGSITYDFATGGGFPKGRHTQLSGVESSGKAQPLYSKVLTPNGWVNMGEVVNGLEVCTPDGGTSTVIGIFPQGVQDVYRIKLNGGAEADATLDHLWEVSKENYSWTEICTTEKIIDLLSTNNDLTIDIFSKSLNVNIPHKIESIELIGREECQCIMIGHPDHLYITDNYIVTHNTTASLMAISNYQKSSDERLALFLDAEFSFDKKYAQSLGIDLSKLLVVQPDHTNQAQEILLELLRKDLIGLFVFDSIAACQPISVLENDSDASNMGKHALAIGNIFKAINGLVSKNKVAAIWINQIRDKIGGYGGGINLPGGHAPKFYASIMIQVNRGSKTENPDGTWTNRGSISVTKNKTYPPYKKGEYDMEHGTGISISQEVLDYGVPTGVIYKEGNTFYYDETFQNKKEDSKQHIKIGGSKAAAKQFLNDNVEFREVLYNKVVETLLGSTEDIEIEDQKD